MKKLTFAHFWYCHRKCSMIWVIYCVQLLGLTLSHCNQMLVLLESMLGLWLFVHIIRYGDVNYSMKRLLFPAFVAFKSKKCLMPFCLKLSFFARSKVNRIELYSSRLSKSMPQSKTVLICLDSPLKEFPHQRA